MLTTTLEVYSFMTVVSLRRSCWHDESRMYTTACSHSKRGIGVHQWVDFRRRCTSVISCVLVCYLFSCGEIAFQYSFRKAMSSSYYDIGITRPPSSCFNHKVKLHFQQPSERLYAQTPFLLVIIPAKMSFSHHIHIHEHKNITPIHIPRAMSVSYLCNWATVQYASSTSHTEEQHIISDERNQTALESSSLMMIVWGVESVECSSSISRLHIQ